MEEIASSVKRVTDIIGEITHESQEQEAGINHINQVITKTDNASQQNAGAELFTCFEKSSFNIHSRRKQTERKNTATTKLATSPRTTPPKIATTPSSEDEA